MMWVMRVAAAGIICLLLTGVACQSRRPPETAQAPAKPVAGVPVGERPRRLTLGLTPFLAEKEMFEEFTPLASYLAEQVGLPVDLKLAESYAALSGLVKNGQVHLAVFSPLAYVRAKEQNPDLKLLVTRIAEGSSTYAAYIIVRAQSRFNTLSDLRGKRFAFVNRHSASGYLYPLIYLRSLKIEPEKFFKSIVFAGNHERLTEMLAKDEVDAGAANEMAFKLVKAKKTPAVHLKILAKAGRIPFDAYCASNRLDPDLIAQVRTALLNLSTNDESGRRVLQMMTFTNGFVEVTDSHYDEVRRVAKMVEDADPQAAGGDIWPR
jgi:phosphate/phosphite/phosphonate ABC transporter binding protein